MAAMAANAVIALSENSTKPAKCASSRAMKTEASPEAKVINTWYPPIRRIIILESPGNGRKGVTSTSTTKTATDSASLNDRIRP